MPVLAASTVSALLGDRLSGAAAKGAAPLVDAATAKDWLARWEKFTLGSAQERACDKETGEGIGWLLSPRLTAFYYGYMATRDTKWVEMLVDWTDSWIRRGLKEPDGFVGWPREDDESEAAHIRYSDSILAEAMGFCPVVHMAGEILKTPALKKKWGGKARAYIELSTQVFQKWDSRDCWREVKDGGIWVVPSFGIDRQSGKWTAEYEQRKTLGFSNPDNKENEIALWMLAMYDVTGKPVYRERAEAWFRLMRSRMKLREDGKYFVWNYWEPAGPWDHKADGSLKHWVGVHPNGGYYWMDVKAIVTAFEHGLVFKREDIDRLIATNRDFMWNQEVRAAKFQRIDGGKVDPRWKDSPGLLWTALTPYDETLRKIFVANHDPADWGGMTVTPWAVWQHVKSVRGSTVIHL